MSSQSWTRRPIYSHLIVSFVTVQMVDIASDNPEPAALKTEAGKWHGFPNKIKAEGRQGWVYSLRGKMIRGTANMNKGICCRETPVNNARVSIPNFVTSSCDSFIGSAMLECEQLNQMTLLIISQHFFFLFTGLLFLSLKYIQVFHDSSCPVCLILSNFYWFPQCLALCRCSMNIWSLKHWASKSWYHLKTWTGGSHSPILLQASTNVMNQSL